MTEIDTESSEGQGGFEESSSQYTESHPKILLATVVEGLTGYVKVVENSQIPGRFTIEYTKKGVEIMDKWSSSDCYRDGTMFPPNATHQTLLGLYQGQSSQT